MIGAVTAHLAKVEAAVKAKTLNIGKLDAIGNDTQLGMHTTDAS
jgi:hypothetical protein